MTHTSDTTTTDIPKTMRAWQWSTCNTTIEEAIQINESAPLPTMKRPLAYGESLIQVHAAALNPVDFKLPELPVVGRMAISKPATPGLDFAGKIVQVGPDCNVKVGQMVFGKLEPKQQFGTLGEYIIGSKAGTAPMPEGISVEEAATLGVCALVTYQCLAPNVKAGDRVLINGGSGGTGTFAIQIAKALGCFVTTTCSAANIQLCQDLGADEVIDYRANDVPSRLSNSPQQYDFILDNVGSLFSLYWKSPLFTKPGAKYVQIGAQPSLPFIYDLAFRFVVPTWLKGGQRPFSFGMAASNFDDFTKVAQLVAEGNVKPVVDEVFAFEDVPRAYQKLRTGRAKGKIVVKIASNL
ncbi:NAD(P)-binding protein [Decorospora gaudefroyi]|uniref:NAD(P)-binding protein n=1 Tax=Decorospora gaudefroyi TaxID=184978 RepID=A0A6A5KEH8_9PLEO|nr:NAD(P)-binding protein [Decorospora gaudefroyi]